ncbi:unnamed protein product [Ostreobium quekettii]|uniref:Uncharacterized protein n=1 Tax=Ostreobium quekettii TaxID=121088 RepID=A0A8S1IN32_9CHLO|nr:unnamed protein product [Ostreobium quekettii]|eukprot:evm.model.scf_408.5 EVM.evm.TU.scf_408.5   scf_408:49949-52550(+)
MPVGGKLHLKGDKPLKGVKKKRKQKKGVAVVPAEEGEKEGQKSKKPAVDPASVSATGHTYEQEFPSEVEKGREGKTRNTPWGSSYRAPPQILHGYRVEVKGDNAQERLDLRCAKKADKFCK